MQLFLKLGIGGIATTIFGIGFGFAFFPWFLNKQIAKSKGLSEGAEMRDMWAKVPFPLDFKMYVFNITNHEAVHKGEIPMLQEIGPIVYDEWKEKVNLVDYEKNDTISFNMKNTWVLNKAKSAPYTGAETVIIPHPALVGMVGTVEIQKPSALAMVNKAIPLLFNAPETIFLKTTIQDLLFNGIFINCTSKEFAAKAICTVLRKEAKDMVPVGDTGFYFSIFGSRNGTAERNEFTVYRGITDAKKVGEMAMLNGKPKLDVWPGDPCNNLVGTDSTIFQPFFTKDMDIVSFSPDLCRSLGAKYVREDEFKKIKTLRYSADFGDPATDPDLKCFCFNETSCHKSGVMNLYKCTGAPVIASLPHFYGAHEDYQKGVKGLEPDEEKHSIIIKMEPMTGSPLYGKKRLQFNFPIHPVNKVEITANLPDTTVPFLWVEEGIELSDEIVAKIDGQLFRMIRIMDVVKWMLTLVGISLVAGALFLFYKHQQDALVVTPTGKKSALGKSDFMGQKQPGSADGGNVNYGYM